MLTVFLTMVNYVQKVCFRAAVDQLKHSSPDQFEAILKKLSAKLLNTEQMHHVSELKTLCNLRPCVGPESMLRVEGRLENASLPVDTKHPYILPRRHALTRLIVLSEHSKAGHAGPSYTLMQTSRGGVLEDVLGLEGTFCPWPRRSSPWPWPRSLKSSKIVLS